MIFSRTLLPPSLERLRLALCQTDPWYYAFLESLTFSPPSNRRSQPRQPRSLGVWRRHPVHH